VHVAALRKALGDGLDGARYIANVPGRGYSFVASVSAASPAIEVVPPPAQAPAPERSQAPLASTLPARLTRMIGRDATVAALSDQLRQCRFVTIGGPGGIGKTTVAVSVAHLLSTEFAGAIFVDLAAVTDSAGVANGLASTLGLTVRQEDPTQEILAFLRDQSVRRSAARSSPADAPAPLGRRIFFGQFQFAEWAAAAAAIMRLTTISGTAPVPHARSWSGRVRGRCCND